MRRPDHRAHEEREDLFPFVAMGLEEEDLPEFARALDRYVAKVLMAEAEWIRTLPSPQQATGLKGPYWYGQGFKDAADFLEEAARNMDDKALPYRAIAEQTRAIALALAARYTSPGREGQPASERLDQGMMNHFIAEDGYGAMAPVTPNQAAETVVAALQ